MTEQPINCLPVIGRGRLPMVTGEPLQARDQVSRADVLFLVCVLLVAFLLRVYVSAVTTYNWDEERDWLVLAHQISLHAGHINLPVRGFHPALPAYFIDMGSLLLGQNPIGYRFASIVAGIASILIGVRLSLKIGGRIAAHWVAVLFAFNEYHIGISALATEKSFYFLGTLLAIYAFVEFLFSQNSKWLYLAGLSTGIAFLCKESAVLIVPAFLIALLWLRPAWLRHREPYLAVALFLFVIAPDVYWNLRHPHGQALQYGYLDHLSRIGGLKFSIQPFIFYARAPLIMAYKFLRWQFPFTGMEYSAMDPLFGFVLVTAVLVSTVRICKYLFRPTSETDIVLLVVFWLIFGFFAVIAPGVPKRPGLPPTSWFFADLTLIPAVLLAGSYLCRLQRSWRVIAVAIVGIAAVVSVFKVAARHLDMPSVVVRYDPEFLWPADGRLVKIHADFGYCAICRPDPEPKLSHIDVISTEAGSASRTSAGAPEVQSALIDSDQRDFYLRAVPGREYDIYFRVRDASGRVRLVGPHIGDRGNHGVQVVQIRPPVQDPFWVHASGGSAQIAHQ